MLAFMQQTPSAIRWTRHQSVMPSRALHVSFGIHSSSIHLNRHDGCRSSFCARNYERVFFTSSATSSMSSSLSFLKGRGMSSSESTGLSFTVTTKAPLRGFSSLMAMETPGMPALRRASSFVALVLNAPQDLHASILTIPPLELQEALAFLSLVASFASSTLRFGAMLSGVLQLRGWPSRFQEYASFSEYKNYTSTR